MEKSNFCEKKRFKFKSVIGKKLTKFKAECGSYAYYQTLKATTKNECEIGHKARYCNITDGKCRLDLLLNSDIDNLFKN